LRIGTNSVVVQVFVDILMRVKQGELDSSREFWHIL